MPKLEPVGPEFFDTAPWQFDIVREIAAPIGEVWPMIAVNENWPKWFGGCRECRSTSDPASGVGSTRLLLGRGLRVDERFIVWEDERVWGFTALEISLPFFARLAERATLSDIGGGRTRIVYRMAAEPRRWAGWLRPFVKLGAERTVGTGLVKIGRLLAGPV
jgi:Polyketide cyclase / dehydrase and lipid transport